MSERDARDAGPSGHEARLQRRARLSLFADLVLLGVCAYVLASDTRAALGGDVDTGVRAGAFLLNLTAAFVLAHRAGAAAQRLLSDPRARRAAGMAKWMLALMVPLLVATQLERLSYQAHRARVDALAADIAARTARAIAAGRSVAPADLHDLGGPYLRALTVRADSGAFLLEVSLPALDIDGYTGRYSSTDGRWLVHHNDGEAAPEPPFARDGPLLKCGRRAVQMHCESP